jgi:hypothetical protein
MSKNVSIRIGGRELPDAYRIHKMTPEERLARIALIIERVDNRAMATDGPVTPTLEEMTQEEISSIYKLAIGASRK